MRFTRTQLALTGTVAIHLALFVVMDVATDLGREERKRAPTVRLVKLDTRPPPPRIEPPKVEPPPEVTPPPPTTPAPPPPPTNRRTPPRQVATTPPPPTSTPPPIAADPPPGTPAPGGAPVVTLPDIAPAARGVAVASGTPTSRRTGRGGEGGGTGEGTGAGSGSGPPIPKVVSIASIKKAAVPKGDYDYFDAHKQYPAEARQLGVGGVVRVQLTIDASGKVVKVRLLGKGLGHGLDELALTRARALQFDPALDSDDRPVASVLTWTFRFEVPA